MGAAYFLAEVAHIQQGLEKTHIWYIPLVGYYPAITRNEVLLHATTWMNREKPLH